MILELSLTLCTKINSKRIRDLNIKHKYIRLAKRHWRKFSWPGIRWRVLYITPKAQFIKKKILSWTSSKFENSVLWNNQLRKWKDSHRVWENICKIWGPEYIKDFKNSTAKKYMPSYIQWQNGQNRHFSEEGVQMANKQMKRWGH